MVSSSTILHKEDTPLVCFNTVQNDTKRNVLLEINLAKTKSLGLIYCPVLSELVGFTRSKSVEKSVPLALTPIPYMHPYPFVDTFT